MSDDVAERLVPTRALMVGYIAQLTKRTGSMPTKATLGFGTWVKLADDDFRPCELGKRDKDGRAFLDIAGIPFYADPDVDEGSVIFDHPTQEQARGRFDGLQFLEI